MFNKNNLIFVAVLLPLGIFLSIFSNEASKVMSDLAGFNITTADIGVTYLLVSIILLFVFKN